MSCWFVQVRCGHKPPQPAGVVSCTMFGFVLVSASLYPTVHLRQKKKKTMSSNPLLNPNIFFNIYLNLALKMNELLFFFFLFFTFSSESSKRGKKELLLHKSDVVRPNIHRSCSCEFFIGPIKLEHILFHVAQFGRQ